jgi:Zn ribbon nucleic-acid-binding protein
MRLRRRARTKSKNPRVVNGLWATVASASGSTRPMSEVQHPISSGRYPPFEQSYTLRLPPDRTPMQTAQTAYKDAPAEWARRKSEFRQSTRWVWALYWTGLAVALIPVVAKVLPSGSKWLLLFVAVAVGLELRQRYLRRIPCPNCGECVVNSMWGKSPIFEPLECMKCGCPLRDSDA